MSNKDLMRAIHNGRYHVVKYLLSTGNVDVEYKNGKPLGCAVNYYVYDQYSDAIARLLIKNGADCKRPEIIQAAVQGYRTLDFVKYLVSHGASIAHIRGEDVDDPQQMMPYLVKEHGIDIESFTGVYYDEMEDRIKSQWPTKQAYLDDVASGRLYLTKVKDVSSLFSRHMWRSM